MGCCEIDQNPFHSTLWSLDDSKVSSFLPQQSPQQKNHPQTYLQPANRHIKVHWRRLKPINSRQKKHQTKGINTLESNTFKSCEMISIEDHALKSLNALHFGPALALSPRLYGSFNCIIYDHVSVHPEPLMSEGRPEVPCALFGPTCDGLGVSVGHSDWDPKASTNLPYSFGL